MKGSLATDNTADILLAVHLSRQSGVVRLSQNDVRKNIYFLEGSIVFAHSNLTQDRLGETLLRLGKITLEEFEAASQDVIQTGKRLGQVLCEKGYLSPGEVISGVHYQLQQIIYSVFNWEEGQYEFIEKERPVFEDIIVEVSTPTLLIDGIRNVANSNVLKRSYDDDETLIVFRRAEGSFARTNLEFAEETLLACIDDKKNIASLRALAHLPSLEFDRSLCSLLLSGLVRLGAPEHVVEQPEPVIVEKWDTVKELDLIREQRAKEAEKLFDFSTQRMESEEDREAIKTFSETDVRRLIVETEQKFRDASDEEVLGVLPDATEEEIQKAYDHLNSLFRPHHDSPTRFNDLGDELSFVLMRVREAYTALLEKRRLQLPFDAVPPLDLNLPEKMSTNGTEEAGETIDTEIASAELLIPDLLEQLRKDPSNASVLRTLGLKLQQSGKAQEGEKQLLRALELEPQNVDNHFALADFYQLQGLRMRAFKHLNVIMQLDPENERAIEMLGLKKRKKALFEVSSNED